MRRTAGGGTTAVVVRRLQRLVTVVVIGAGVTVGAVGAVLFGLRRSNLLGAIVAADVAAAIALGVALIAQRRQRARWDYRVAALASSATGGPAAGLHNQAELIRRSVRADGVALLLAPLDQPLATAAVAGRVPAGIRTGVHHPDQATAVRAGQPAKASGWLVTRDPEPFHLPGAFVATCTLAPIGSSGGLIVVWSERPSVRALRQLGVIAGVAAESIEHSRLDEAEYRSRLGAVHARRHMTLLVNAGASLAKAIDDWQPALDEIAADIVPDHVDYFAVDMVRPDGGSQRIIASHVDGWNLEIAAHPAAVVADWHRSLSHVATRGTRLIFPSRHPDPTNDGSADSDEGVEKLHRHLGLASWAVIPVHLRGDTVGVFTIGTVAPRRGLRPSDVAAYEELVSRCALAYERISLYREAATREERLRSLVEASPLAILETAPSGELRSGNRAAAELFGWTSDAPELDRSTRDLLDGLRRRLADGARIVAERATIAHTGDHAPITVSIAASLIAGTGTGDRDMVCMLTDITQQERLELALQARERMEALGRLAGGVAHDFNNLLTVIVGYSEMLAEDLGAGHPMYDDIDAIRSAGRRAAAFTEQLLTISRRRVSDVVRTVELAPCMMAMEPVLRRLIGSDVTLVFETSEDAGWVQIDVSQLEQVLLNLVVNARDAMPDGGRLTVAVAPTTDEAGQIWATLTVTDTGVGMDAVTRERCFEPFFTTKGLGQGTGLGLATVYTVVDQAGGVLSIDTAPGRGTSIQATFPRAVPTVVKTPEVGSGRRSAPAGTTILLVEDDDMVRSFASSVLTGAGYTVLEAAEAQSAIEVARGEVSPRALITDVVMPGMSGPELAAELPHLPALYISGYVEDDRRRQLLQETPSSRFLAKPFRADELLDALDDVLATAAQGSNR